MRHGGVRIVVIGLVARNAGRIRDVVIVVDVAIGALTWRHQVIAGQRKRGLRVIKGRWLPCTRGVADFASLQRNLQTRGCRIGRALEVFQVARNARRSRQIVVPIDVAIRTLPRRNRVHAGQREVHRIVIEARRRPPTRGMALPAVRREARRHVIGIPGALEIRHVTADAGGGGQVVVVEVDVTITTH